MNAKQVFDRAALDYDRNRRQLVPHFDDFYGMVLELIPHPYTAPIRVLDVGAGTGLLSALISEMFPNAVLTLADISEEMLGRARVRFADRDQVNYLTLDLENDALTGEYDVAVSSLALHHIEPDHLAAVFQNIYAVLVGGGWMINADQTLGTSTGNEARYAAQWVADVRRQGTTEPDLAAALERLKADKTATLEDQLAALRAAGFEQVDCWYKRYRFAVYSGRKSSG